MAFKVSLELFLLVFLKLEAYYLSYLLLLKIYKQDILFNVLIYLSIKYDYLFLKMEDIHITLHTYIYRLTKYHI